MYMYNYIICSSMCILRCTCTCICTMYFIYTVYIQLSLDGRGLNVQGYEKGNFVGPTVLSDAKVGYCTFIYL